MLRISQSETSAALTVKLEGKLLQPWVAEVCRHVESITTDRRAHCLNLSNVTYVDVPGAELLRRLKAGGAQIVACSSFIAEVINREVR